MATSVGVRLRGDRDHARRLTWWVALLTAVTAAMSLSVAIGTPPRSGPFCSGGCLSYPYLDTGAFVPRDYLWMYPALAVTALAVLLAACLHERVPARRRALVRAGRSFVAIGATALLLDYGVQLTVLQPALLSGQVEGLVPWTQYLPYGLFIAFENVGYSALNVGLGLLGAGLLARTDRWERRVGWVFVATGVLTVIALVSFAGLYGTRLDYRFEVWSIFLGWAALIVGPGLLLITNHPRAPASGRTARLNGPGGRPR